MVATGQIAIEQPGRRATGGRLVYTASDQIFVLTGEGKTQPKLVDSERGTITGATLRFHSGDNSVVVSNVEPGATGAATGQRVRSETRVDKQGGTGKE
jgi:lipopolysaccharide export system protein LptA